MATLFFENGLGTVPDTPFVSGMDGKLARRRLRPGIPAVANAI
jgi:hypothetical protein